jgi:hypothetical protein
MKTPRITIPAMIALLGSLTTGCVTYTAVKDEPREGIRFSSPEAAQTFYDAYLSTFSPKGHGSVTIGEWPPLPYRQRTVSTDNVRFNSAVQSVDSNHDGVISDDEARAYAAKVRLKFEQSGPSTSRDS